MRKLIFLIVLLVLIVLIGCNKQIEPECKNITKTIETIKYINNTIIEKVNITCNKESRELELIRRLKFLENQQDKTINDTECIIHNATEEKLQNCRNKNDMYKRDIDELDEEIEDCEEELCEWNSTRC